MNRALAPFLVLFLSLSLLIYIGLNEARRVYPVLQLDNICSQAELYKNVIDSMLKVGLPIEYSGFNTRARQLKNKSALIDDAYIVAKQREDRTGTELGCRFSDEPRQVQIDLDWRRLLSDGDSDRRYRIVLELEDKLGHAGDLVLEVKSSELVGRVHQVFRHVIWLTLALLSLSLAAMLYLQIRGDARAGTFNKVIYHLSFFIVGVAILLSLVNIYGEGIKHKSSALTQSLAERLRVPIEMGFDIERDFSGIEQMLDDYRRQSGDIGYISISTEGERLFESGKSDYTSPRDLADGCDQTHISRPAQDNIVFCQTLDAIRNILLQARVPKSAVYFKLLRAVRNILMLFIATTLISNLFFNLLTALQGALGKISDSRRGVSLLQPVYTLGVFAEALSLSFLPGYVTHTLGGHGSVSTVFGVYFLCFALVLVPAGRYAARHNLRNMMAFGLILCAAGLLLLAVAGTFYQILLARAVSAAGQGILLIAVQSYLLRLEDGGNVSGGTSVIVLGFNIGTISGTAIGALLVATMGEQAVFWIGALIAAFCMAYTFWMIQDVDGGRPLPASTDSEGDATGGIWHVLFNFELLKTILLVGIPTKAVFAGVLIFAMPIILQQQGFEHDLIGQMLIFYSIGILITTYFIRPISGFFRATSVVLLVGSLGAGAGLLLIGSQAWLLDAAMQSGWCEGDCKPVGALAIVGGVLVLGLFHGLIHAPVVSYITRIPGTELVGKSVVAANYRLLERIGHMIGPPVAAALLLAADGSLQLMHVIYLGGGIMAAGLAFFLVRHSVLWRTQ